MDEMKKYILSEFENRLKNGEKPSRLMSEMEVMFEIPLQASEEFEKRNPDVIALYKVISDTRNL